MKRIAITGYSGSGKSVLAGQLGKLYGCPVLHLDCVHWLPGWKERDSKESAAIVSQFMDRHSSWVIDGNYKKLCYERKLEEATDIIYMAFPRRVCLYRVLKRYFNNRGRSRKSMAKGCEEKVDREFLWWVLYKGRDRKHQARYQRMCKKYAGKVTVLRNPGEVGKYLASLKRHNA